MKCIHIGKRVGTAVKINCNSIVLYKQARECPIHNRCIHDYEPTTRKLEEWRTRPEAELYQLCYICPDMSTGT